MALKVGFCVSGNGHLFRAAVQNAGLLGITPALLVLDGQASKEVESFASTHRVRCERIPYQDRATADQRITRVCIDAELDLICLTFDKLLPAALVEHYAGRIVNVHMALLPAFKGKQAIAQALDFGARFLGATIHEVDEEMDHGPIIAQCVQGVREDDSEAAAGARLFAQLRQMYLQVIAWYAQGRIQVDGKGRLFVTDARYGEFPISPAVEMTFQ